MLRTQPSSSLHVCVYFGVDFEEYSHSRNTCTLKSVDLGVRIRNILEFRMLKRGIDGCRHWGNGPWCIVNFSIAILRLMLWWNFSWSLKRIPVSGCLGVHTTCPSRIYQTPIKTSLYTLLTSMYIEAAAIRAVG